MSEMRIEDMNEDQIKIAIYDRAQELAKAQNTIRILEEELAKRKSSKREEK